MPFSYFREVEGITILSLQRKYLCSSLAIRFKERFLCFSLTLISLLRWHSAKAIDLNEWLKAPGDFLTQETEIQTLLFGKWLKKKLLRRKEKLFSCDYKDLELPMSRRARQCLPVWAACCIPVSRIQQAQVFRWIFDRTKWSCRFWLQHKEYIIQIRVM